jgi:polar amino acid transport system substrate-binding protein
MRARALGSVIAVALLTLSACGSDDSSSEGSESSDSGAAALPVVSEGSLTVCSDIPYPPFEVQEDGEYTGFDLDLMGEIASGLDLELAVKDTGFDALQSGLTLNSNQCDVAASAMTITDEREENLDFTDAYYDSEQSLLVPEGSDIASIDDLGGKKVGVQQGTTGKSYTEENAPSDTEVVSFPSDGEMFQAIKAGQVDALLQDLPVNIEHERAGGFTVVEQYDTGEQYGFAVKQDNTEVLDAINEQLAELRDSGRYQEIYDEYFTAG